MESLPISVLFFVLALDKCPCPVSAPQLLTELCRAQESDGAPFIVLPGLAGLTAFSARSCFHANKETGRNLFSFLLPSQEQMASAQIWRNNDRNWIPPRMLTVGIWTGFLGLLSKKLECQALFLSCWFGIFSICYLAPRTASPCAHTPYSEPTGHCPVLWNMRLPSASAAGRSCPLRAEFLKSTQEQSSSVCLSS